MRYTRLFLGICAVLVALWILVGEQLAGVSADATVNARLVAVRAPIAGEVTLDPAPLGSRVARGDELAQLSDSRADSIRLDDLLLERATAAAAIDREKSVLAALEAAHDTLTERSASYAESRLAELNQRLEEADARLKLLEAAPGTENNTVAATLSQGQTDNPGDPLLSGVALKYARERVATLKTAIAAAEAGTYLGDGYNDAPWSEQRAYDLATEIATHTATLTELEARHKLIGDRATAERLRVNRLSTAAILAPVSGLLWDLRTSTGEMLQRGDLMMVMLDCASTFITASVTEDVYNDLRTGDPASFRAASTGQTYEGTVARLAGAGAGTIYTGLAVAPSVKHLERYDVAIEIPGLRADPDLGCAVGQTGRVFFGDRPLDFLRR